MNYCPKRKKSRKKISKAKISLCILLLVFVLIFWYIYAIVNPIIIETSEAKIKSVATSTLSTSVLTVISNSTLFEHLMKYQYDDKGKISLISVSSASANLLAREITAVAQTQLDDTTSTGIGVHLGAFTGIAVFASSGPLINVNLTPIGAVQATFKSEFVSAGINQTLHKIFICVESSIFVVLPFSSPKLDIETEVLITETLIVGEIPSTYLQSSYLDEMLNLVPV